MDIFQIWKEIIIAQCNKCKVSQRTGQFSWGLKNEEVALQWFSEATRLPPHPPTSERIKRAYKSRVCSQDLVGCPAHSRRSKHLLNRQIRQTAQLWVIPHLEQSSQHYLPSENCVECLQNDQEFTVTMLMRKKREDASLPGASKTLRGWPHAQSLPPPPTHTHTHTQGSSLVLRFHPPLPHLDLRTCCSLHLRAKYCPPSPPSCVGSNVTLFKDLTPFPALFFSLALILHTKHFIHVFDFPTRI